MAKRGVKVGTFLAQADDIHIPAHVYREHRLDVRFSLTQRGLHIRVPSLAGKASIDEHIQKATDWLTETLRSNPLLADKWRSRYLYNGKSYLIGDDQYTLVVSHHFDDSNKLSISLEDHQLILTIPSSTTLVAQNDGCKRLISKVLSNKYLGQVTARVHALNEQHFKKPIKRVKLTYTSSKWGSCKTDGTIQLSSRLLLAPLEVQDAVIIHELAHLIEPNHSVRFWNQVQRALPNYKVYDVWLKKYGSTLDY